jgi:hypothetical protein
MSVPTGACEVAVHVSSPAIGVLGVQPELRLTTVGGWVTGWLLNEVMRKLTLPVFGERNCGRRSWLLGATADIGATIVYFTAVDWNSSGAGVAPPLGVGLLPPPPPHAVRVVAIKVKASAVKRVREGKFINVAVSGRSGRDRMA